jgi:hypothetical protein
MDHIGHEVVTVRGRRQTGAPIAFAVCVDCQAIDRLLALCGAPTRSGEPCRVVVRDDLGFSRCWNHRTGG